MALNTNERLQEAFSLALEDRSKGYADLVSNSNALLHVMKKRDQFKEFSGPTIRERLLYGETNSYIRYSGYQLLNPTPAELFNDAEFTPKLAAVSVTLSGEDILKNSGVSQLKDIMEEHIGAAEQELTDRFVEDLHSAGVAANQIGGLQLVLPTNVSAGTYGGIARSNAIWQTSAYDANSAFAGITQVTGANIKSIFDQIMIARSRYNKGPDLILSASEHYQAFSSALVAIQQITNESELGKLGFSALRYIGARRQVGGRGAGRRHRHGHAGEHDLLHRHQGAEIPLPPGPQLREVRRQADAGQPGRHRAAYRLLRRAHHEQPAAHGEALRLEPGFIERTGPWPA